MAFNQDLLKGNTPNPSYLPTSNGFSKILNPLHSLESEIIYIYLHQLLRNYLGLPLTPLCSDLSGILNPQHPTSTDFSAIIFVSYTANHWLQRSLRRSSTRFSGIICPQHRIQWNSKSLIQTSTSFNVTLNLPHRIGLLLQTS